MAVFERLKRRIALRKGIRTTYQPFFDSAGDQLRTFTVVQKAVPQNVVELYEEILHFKGKRYQRLREDYERFLTRVDEHNKTVLRLRSRLGSLDLDAFLADPSIWDSPFVGELKSSLATAKGLDFAIEDPYWSLYERATDYAHHFDEIKRQNSVFNDIQSLKNEISNNDRFIRHDKALEYLSKRDNFRVALGKPEKTYYDFGFLDRLEGFLAGHNAKIAANEASLPLFDDIGGFSLDAQQRRAAVAGERNALVVAAAGSGKTMTICGRLKYLVERAGVSPSRILLLSYSKKSADDLAKRAEEVCPGVIAQTFHKTGLDILKTASGGQFVVEEQFDAIVETYFREELFNDPSALRDVLIYYGLFLNNGETVRKYHDEGELFADLKKDDFVTFKESLLKLSRDPSAMETIKREKVKSFEEMAIANFYFINGISYEYERPYEFDESTPERRQYTPDFYLPEYGIYHEHYGLDENGRAKQYDGVAERNYVSGVTWKQKCHAKNQTTCIETFSYEFSDNTVFEKLEAKLKEQGVAFRPLSDDKIKEALRSVYGGRSYASFINLVKSFISLYKSRYEDDSAFEELKKTQFKTKYGKVRADLFLSICQKVLEYYRDRVRLEGKIDFDDMILKAMRVLPDLPRFRFEHILVDEFQDISYSRFQFLKALIEHGQSNLFAVGDDWQSIYRFSGCDVNIFLHFEEHFGFSEIHKIGNVHRNSQQLQDAMAKFIESNPEQLKKEIHSDKRIADPIRVMYYDDDGYLALMRTLGLIAKNHPEANVLLLGRNNKDIEPYLAHDFFYDKKADRYRCSRYPGLNLSYSTVHGSKGLEEDFVILLSAEDAPNGFPNKTEDDPLLNLVMSEPSRYLFAEERRLWYVALTRTRSYVFILVPKTAPSLFIDEMRGSFKEINPSEKDDPSSLVSCPRCGSGHLVLRQKEDGRPFYGCSNYPYCKYTIDDLEAVSRNKRCLVCGDFMILKKGKWGSFYGCHSYPRCKFTIKHDPRIPEK